MGRSSDSLIHRSIDVPIYWSKESFLLSSSPFLLLWFKVPFSLRSPFRVIDHSGSLFRCPTIHSGFATVFAERLETSTYQCGRICGRWVDDVSLSISSSFKETLNRFCASWGKQPLPFIPVALRQIWLLANQVEYGRTRIGTLRHLVTCFSLNCFPQRSCTFFSLLLTHKVNSSWLCLSGFCFVCWFHIKNINYTTMLMLAYAPPPPPQKKSAIFKVDVRLWSLPFIYICLYIRKSQMSLASGTGSPGWSRTPPELVCGMRLWNR